MKVFIVAMITADGLMGAHEGHNSRDWRSRDDGRLFNRLVNFAGVMVMGATTYRTFRIFRAPFGKRLFVYTHHPEHVTLGENVEITSADPAELVKQLDSEGYKGLAVCGGAQINTLFLEAGVVDELYLTIEPQLFGSGVPLFTKDIDQRLTLLDSATYQGGAITVHYALRKSE